LQPKGLVKCLFNGRNYKAGKIVCVLIMLFVLITVSLQPQILATAYPILSVSPITSNVVGLDSINDNSGQNTFPVEEQVCTTGDVSATDLTGHLPATLDIPQILYQCPSLSGYFFMKYGRQVW
jgi:hypothetical protein